jgi:hypothetical protein
MKQRITVASLNGPREIDAHRIGPFSVHRFGTVVSFGGMKWGVTHNLTGCTAAQGPTKKACMHAARRLRNVGADWSFTDPMEAKNISKELRKKIRVVCAACSQGFEA